MDELLSYSLADLLMFSPQTYARLFELYHRSLWPAQLPVAAMALWLVAATRRADVLRARLVSLLLALAWAAIAWFFFLRHYATLHLAAPWFALGFAVQALLLLLVGALGGMVRYGWRDSAIGMVGLCLLLAALFLAPLLALLAGRPWQGLELFGLTPDATALGTLGLLLMGKGRARWLLLPLPLLWCAISLLTYAAMVMKG